MPDFPIATERLDMTPLAIKLREIQTRRQNFEPEAIAEVVQAVLTTMRGDLTVTEATLLAEVEELGRTIAAAKAEIAALRVGDIKEHDIPFATDELDAIVKHTAAATHAILESCETLDNVADAVTGEPSTQLQDAVTRIYEACSFQDITGQRITKVVTTLKTIEEKIANIMQTFGHAARAQDRPERTGPATESDLLNGPQLPALAMDQSDIDKLLASFD
ncbi:MAG: protein phosphatase CheZ [Acetobacteraceae bacterium]